MHTISAAGTAACCTQGLHSTLLLSQWQASQQNTSQEKYNKSKRNRHMQLHTVCYRNTNSPLTSATIFDSCCLNCREALRIKALPASPSPAGPAASWSAYPCSQLPSCVRAFATAVAALGSPLCPALAVTAAERGPNAAGSESSRGSSASAESSTRSAGVSSKSRRRSSNSWKWLTTLRVPAGAVAAGGHHVRTPPWSDTAEVKNS